MQLKPLRVHVIFWNALGPGSVAYTITELLDNVSKEVEPTLWCLRGDPTAPRQYHSPALPDFLFRALCKVNLQASFQGRFASEVTIHSIRAGDIVYVWPPYDLRLIKRARERGAIVVAERINCMGEMVREVLLRAYARRGLQLPNGWCTKREIEEDREQMLQCDFVTAPNGLVAESIRNAGVCQEQILETSYGFNPIRLASAINLERPHRPPVFAFVGLGIVRKGIDVLLEAWEQASVKGKLIIAGQIDEQVRSDYASTLSRPDVCELGYVQDIANVYAAADIFVFPSHEEGGPQVVYEAAACGLAGIVSPMGAGRVVRDRIEGLIVDPLNVHSVAKALVELAENESLRRTLGINAAARAHEYTWSRVAKRLCAQFHEIAQRPVVSNSAV